MAGGSVADQQWIGKEKAATLGVAALQDWRRVMGIANARRALQTCCCTRCSSLIRTLAAARAVRPFTSAVPI